MAAVPTGRPAGATRGGRGSVGIGAVVRSEWTKFRSVRSTTVSLLVMVVLIVGLGALSTALTTANWSSTGPADRLTFDPTNRSLVGILFGQLAIGVLGVLVISAEYGTGTIRATFAAVPRRPMVLMAKAVVFGAVGLLVSEVTAFAAFFVGQSLLTGATPHAVLSQPDVLRAVVGSGLYLAVLGLFGLGIAAIVRHTAGGIATFVGLLLVLPLIVEALPSSIRDPVAKYLPAVIGEVMTSAVSARAARDFPVLGPWAGFGLLCAYAAAALVLGGIVVVRRDA